MVTKRRTGKKRAAGKVTKHKRKRLPAVLTEEELDALLDAPSSKSVLGVRNKMILALMGKCGLRVSEVCNLKTSDVKLTTKDPHIRVIGKGDKERIAWLGNGTRDLLALWLTMRPKKTRALFPVVQSGARTYGQAKPGNPVKTGSVRNMVSHFAKKVLGRHVNPHRLRHTAATLALQKGENLRNLQEFLGHANLNTTQIYLSVSGKELSAMARRLDPGQEKPQAENTTPDLAAVLGTLSIGAKEELAAALLASCGKEK